MKAFARGMAVMLTTTLLLGVSLVLPAAAQDPAALDSERAQVSYMVGHDIARSYAPAATDIDLEALELAISNAFAGGEPLIEASDAEAVSRALMQRVAVRAGRAPAGTGIPPIDKQQVAYLIGADVGRTLQPMKAELDVAILLQGVRATFAGGGLKMSEAELNTTRQAFAQKMRGKIESRMQALAATNQAAGTDFLAANKLRKGVFTTPSGLQYMVLRPGAGPRPLPTDRVRVNYEGKLLDGTVFDSSYERGEPAEFALNQVIAGWTEGVAMMPVGAKYRFWIPSDLAYGSKGGGPIGPNAMLTFDVELQAIVE